MEFIHTVTVLAITILIFLVCREIICWYWKINERTNVLKEIMEESKITNQLLFELSQELHNK